MDTRIPSPTEVRVATGAIHLTGDLVLPQDAHGVVVFAHGSGSGRHSSRNRAVARQLQEAGLATLLLDLLTPEEDSVDRRTRHLRFDIPLLSRRMEDTTAWVLRHPDLRHLPGGYFGASTGSAAALIAAAHRGRRISAVASGGGRRDLVGPTVLEAVPAPALLIVGGADAAVIPLNTQAYDRLRAIREFVLIADASHLFEEPGALEDVARLATDWFSRHLVPQRQPA